MIVAENVGISIGKKRIVIDAGFVAEAGEITTIVGPNGSGKTTLLRAVSGDLAYTGSIRMHDREIRRFKPWEMAELRGVLPQVSALSFPFTVAEVVRLGAAGGRSGAAMPSIDHLVMHALETVDLDGFSGRFYQELSGGEQQRVQLARVLCQVAEPRIDGVACGLFLDEPISSLDIRHQLAIMDIAREYAAAGGAVIAVLHDLNLTAMYSDKVLAMHNGRCAGFGPTADILRDALLQEVFECNLRVGVAPGDSAAFVLPQSAIQPTKAHPVAGPA